MRQPCRPDSAADLRKPLRQNPYQNRKENALHPCRNLRCRTGIPVHPALLPLQHDRRNDCHDGRRPPLHDDVPQPGCRTHAGHHAQTAQSQGQRNHQHHGLLRRSFRYGARNGLRPFQVPQERESQPHDNRASVRHRFRADGHFRSGSVLHGQGEQDRRGNQG